MASTYNIPNAGLTKVLNLLATGMYMAAGTGTTPPAASDTTLEGELARNAVSTYTVNGSTSIQFKGYFTSGQVGGQTIEKVAIFDASSSGNMLCQELATLVVAAGNGAIVTITYPIARV